MVNMAHPSMVMWHQKALQLVCVLIACMLCCGTIHEIRPMNEDLFHFTHTHYNTSIFENAIGKTYVTTEKVKMGIFTTDPTLFIKYRVVGGDTTRFFRAEEKKVGDFSFLRIRTRTTVSAVLNRERQQSFNLSVKAVARYPHGPKLIAQTTVTVLVLDANDLSPLFYPTSYSVDIPENMPLYGSVITVSASDADIGINGEVYYSFEKKTHTFAIHPTSGIVILTDHLAFMDVDRYHMTVLAMDRGPSMGYQARVSRARLQVNVKEVNYHAPNIELQKLPTIVEHGSVGTVYGILYVHDKDVGINGKIGKVEIVSGDTDGYFQIQQGRGQNEFQIKVAKMLDRETDPLGFNLTVSASDQGTPTKSSTRLIHVTLQDTNDQRPLFESDRYEVTVEETVPPQTPLVFVHARDTDIGKNAEIVYTIQSGNDRGWFVIDQSTGLLSVAATLDADVIDKVELNVSAHDQANMGSRKTSYARVVVHIKDSNDNAPTFQSSKPVVSIIENEPIGTEVFQVRAHDADSGDNGYISYSISNAGTTPFAIDAFTGKITTRKVLDFEAMARIYKLRVRASDWGSPYRRESEMELTVRLKDINDNKPMFEKVNCVGFLSREAPIGIELVVISAIDFDTGNIISYEIVSGDLDNCFQLMSSSGLVRTRCSMKDLRRDFYTLVVTATDGKHSADTTTINITVVNNKRNRQLSNEDASFSCIDTAVAEKYSRLLHEAEQKSAKQVLLGGSTDTVSQNVHAPRFDSNMPKKITISEGLAKDHNIISISAKDEDHGYNGRLQYVITSGNEGSTFKMDTHSGDLLVMNTVDRETRDMYTITIGVSDMGSPAKSASAVLQIDVKDINDNAPEFYKDSYRVRVAEDVKLNTSIIRVHATDGDMDKNAEVSYSIVSDTPHFSINHHTGNIIITTALDQEKHKEHHIEVQATDASETNPLSSVVTVTVIVEDVNDNVPTFVPSSYHVQIREDLPVGAVVMTIVAMDADQGNSGAVRYSLLAGMDDKFEVDRQAGTIRILKPLDFETKQRYNITARARDRGQHSSNARCHVIIDVTDVNENLHAPVFSDFVVRGEVAEGLPVNTTVMQVTATDADSDNPSAIPGDYTLTYSIKDGSGLGLFNIDNTGMIRTNAMLDRESKSSYWLTVYAQDSGTVSLSAMLHVYIEVSDINDNIPQTYEPVYSPAVPENSPANTSVLQLFAYDLDGSTNGQLTYRITSGNPQGFFHIDETSGLITTTNRVLDREKQEEHILEVTVQDNGSPQLSSTTRVVVTVTDENDEKPMFMSLQYKVRIPAMSTGTYNTPLYRVVAFDRDQGPNADIDYSIKSGRGNGRFSIHPKTGVIFSKKDFVAGSKYDLIVKAVDNGRPQQSNTARLMFTVLSSPATSAHPPKFVSGHQYAHVMENAQVGHMVQLMSAEDEDGDKLWYSITAGNEEATFSIDRENGNMILARPLDWERKKSYNLTVSVTDTVDTTVTQVQVTVQDIIDNRPLFSESTYSVDVWENVTVGSAILTVSASDLDEDKRLFYTIHSVMDQASRGKFRINSQTGVITILDKLNRQTLNRHQLTIMVRDQATRSKRSLARVVVYVLDRNDHAPKFLQETYKGRVFETAAVGTDVLQVIAVDDDIGENAKLDYSILSGNIGNTFSIDPTMGKISTAKPLDQTKVSKYQLVVKSVDGGTPAMSSSATVDITVTASSDMVPQFELREYITEVPENQPVGTYVTTVTASSHSSVTYMILGDAARYFTINPFSGVITSGMQFDFEGVNFYNLTARATSMRGDMAWCTVLVHIVDVNDNHPVFAHETYVGNISEAAPPNSVVLDTVSAPLVVKASDADTSINALLTYSIVEPDAAEVFTIDPTTGAIRSHTSVDHEETATYTFHVQVRDHGSPMYTAIVPARVIVHVTDVNDSPPKFCQDYYHVQLLLPTYTGVVVATVNATDADSPPNAQLKYNLGLGNEEKHFVINSATGMVRVMNAANLGKYYEIEVIVTDGNLRSLALLKIRIKETETTGLRFDHSAYHAEVVENSTEIDQLLVLQPQGHDLGEHLVFSVRNPDDMFVVGHTSGVLQTTGRVFDHEAKANYTVVVQVSDMRTPPRLAHALVHVSIIDINDNAPMFVNQPYYASVSVNADIGHLIKKVHAVDLDSGVNGEIMYELVKGDGDKFLVRGKTGEITLKRRLQSEDENNKFELVIEAKDKGDPSLRSQVSVSVTVTNKATPVFTQSQYRVVVPENVPLHMAVASLEAHSPSSHKLIYSIAEGNVYDEFSIDFNTGSVSVVDELDYETRRRYELTIRATDMMTGSYADVLLHVRIQDVNDHPPSFTSLHYVVTVSEATPIGTSILMVSAADDDSGINAQIQYLIDVSVNIECSSYFHVDPDHGTVLTKKAFDYETLSRLQFNMVAVDGGVPALSSTVPITVILTDLNDNPPRFDQPFYEVVITDLLRRGQFVSRVTASDADSPDSTDLGYAIIGGNKRRSFTIEGDTGVLRLSRLRTPDLLPSYVLNVSVTDGVFTSFARIKIIVRNSNGHVPEFIQGVYDVDVSENLPAGQQVATLRAKDGDQGRFGRLTYAIESDDAEEIFSIDKDTGELFTKVALDREMSAQYVVPVVARDGGGRTGYTQVRVNVADKGDHSPQFQLNQYKANVYANTPLHTSILQVTAVDMDLGSNSDIEYSIYDGQSARVNDWFTIDTSSGIIKLKQALIGKENELFQLFVRATDLGSPPQENDVPVEVYVMGEKDAPPTFPKSYYKYFISEDQSVGYVVTTVSARSTDTLKYSIVAGALDYTNNPAKFAINDKGEIRVIEGLDRETTERFELTVRAETKTSPSLVGFVHITVPLMDVNDNPPKFESNPYHVSVAENAAIGSNIVQVIAHDTDNGVSAEISYAFAPISAKLSSVFAVDAHSGWVNTLVKLDRETTPSYELHVVATDRGTVALSDTTIIKVTITDHNDEPPAFSQRNYDASVMEDALPGTIVVTVSTTDADLEMNANVVYHICDGDKRGQFAVRPGGEIYVNKELDRERQSRYKLKVMATDGAFVTSAIIHVSVLDANDNSPVCYMPMYEKVVAENVAVGTVIARVTASDEDEPGTRNSAIEYSLDPTADATFKIHKTEGIVSTAEALDRETVDKYMLTVRATDGGGRSCTSQVYITLSDVNDNAPVFTMSSYQVMIPEDAQVNTLLTRMTAIDSDLGINHKVKYALRDSLGHFRIDPVSGILSLTKELDREQQPQFNLTVYAYDQGTPKMTSTAYILVLLLDINDNPPEFERAIYGVILPEDTQVDTSVVTVFATSRDTGVNAEIVYTIVHGNELAQFRVDSKTGVISLIEPLDYERMNQYFLTVEASDGGMPPLRTTTIVKMNVTDANDNAPNFAMPVYSATLREDVQLQHSVIQVKATDTDSPPNAQITYRLTAGDPLQQFSIHPKDGVISVVAPLDRETVATYTLEVEASDSGVPQLKGHTAVKIEVEDSNDCPPIFSQTNYSAVVQEDRGIGYSILQLEVTDADTGLNAAPFSFDVVTGNKDTKFRVDSSGLLMTTAKFDREIKDTYQLTIRVFDNGTPPLHSDTRVTVTIIEESSFPPLITPLSVTVTTYGDEFAGGVIGRVKAIDRDAYDHLMYSIVDNESHLFDIHLFDGTIKASQSVDAGEYNLNVSVTDGKYVAYSPVRLVIVAISESIAANAIVIRLRNMLPELFIASHRDAFIEALRDELSVRRQDVQILSVQPASDTVAKPGRKKRSTESDLDVLLAVQRSRDGAYYRGNVLRRRVAEAAGRLSKKTGVGIAKVFNDVCNKERCGKGKCKTVVKFQDDQMFTIITDSESYVTARHEFGYTCKCKAGFTGAKCNMKVDLCNPSPCPLYRECKTEGAGYVCRCPAGFSGDYCEKNEADLDTICVDAACRKDKPLTFSGSSYVGWRLSIKTERRLSLALQVRTVQHSARLMHAGGGVDYTILEMDGGLVQFRFDCGSGQGLTRVDTIKINDGYWHSIVLERLGKNAKIIIDGTHTAHGSAPGTNDVLNLDSNDVFFGAEVTVMADGREDISHGFIGCMRDLIIDAVRLPMAGSSSVAVFKNPHNIEFHCRGAYIPGVCSSSPCLNGGSCRPVGQDSYTCQCRGRFNGPRCEIDTNPCASSPCLHSGVCKNIGSDFKCTCRGHLQGKRCEKNFYCHSNPCKHGGSCLDGIRGPKCTCTSGFRGDLCEYDVDECRQNPCRNGAICNNLYGSFTCNCTSGIGGELCDEVDLTSITSSPANINLDEILGIIGVLACIIVIVIIFVIVMRYRRNQCRRRRHRDTTTLAEYSYNNMKSHTKTSKISEEESTANFMHHNIPPDTPMLPPSPHPPPVLPPRPASYTPSNAGGSVNTLNNFDNIPDEVQNMSTITQPIEIPAFMQNVDVEKPPEGCPAPPPRYHNVRPLNTPIEHMEKQGLCAADIDDNMQAAAGRPMGHPGYHWDTSDWHPDQTPLPNIAEIPMREIPDTQSSCAPSDDGNSQLIDPDAYDNYTDYAEDLGEHDSEYVGDSEYGETEFETEDFDDDDEPIVDFGETPNYEEMLAQQNNLVYEVTDDNDDDDDESRVNYNIHPNDYLPHYSIDNMQTDDDDSCYQGAAARQPEYEHSTLSALDDMSVSVGGYASTAVSCSGLSGLCEIEDSEINVSDEDSEDDNCSSTKISSSHIHTDV